MAITTKRLASGQLTTTSLTTLYTCPALTKATISFGSFVQAGATATDFDLYVHDGTANRGIARKVGLEGNTGAFYMDPIEMTAGDILKAQISVAGAIDYYVCGIEET